MDKQPPRDQVKKADTQAVRQCQQDRHQDAVPVLRHHQVERQVADRVEVALRARRKKILREPPAKQLVRQVIVVVEQIPADILAGVQRPPRANEGRQAEHQPRRRAGSAPFGYRLLRDLSCLTRSSTALAAFSSPSRRYWFWSSLKAAFPGEGHTDTAVSRSRVAPALSRTLARSTPRM